MAFKPNALTFAQGVKRIEDANKAAGLKVGKDIVTSRSSTAKAALSGLQISNIPSGFTKWQLPVYMDGPSQMFYSVGAPNADVPSHSHDEGDGLRVIVSGSILHEGMELTEGDWMFIPKGTPYKFKVGNVGVGMFYCYQCCCA